MSKLFEGKRKFVLPLVVVILLGGLYQMVLAKPAPEPKHKIEGEVYILPKEFLINLSDDRYAKLSVALIMEPATGAEAGGGGHGAEAAKPPEGFGPLPQEAVVRDLITDEVTDVSADELIGRKGRRELKEHILKSIKKNTDVHVEDVLFTDVAVQ